MATAFRRMRQAMELTGITKLIPSGRYVLGLVWYETLTGKNCLESDYVPEGMCVELARAAREMVHRYLA